MLAPLAITTPIAERRLAALAHEEVGRVLEAARHGRDVAEAEDAPVRLDRRLGDGPRPVERAGDAHRHALRAGLDGAGRHDGVLAGERIEQGLRRDAEGRELGVAELDEDLLVLHAVEVDLGHARHAAGAAGAAPRRPP